MKRFKSSLVLLVVLMVFLSACSSGAISSSSSNESSNNGDTIKIGALLPSTGVYASLGENLLNGLNLYFERQIWEVAGKKIEIIHEDSEADPQVSLRKLRKLMDQDSIDILTGPISTAVAYAIRDEVDSKKLPFLFLMLGK